MPGLRESFAREGAIRETVAFKNGDAIEMFEECLRGQKAGQAAADDECLILAIAWFEITSFPPHVRILHLSHFHPPSPS